MCMGGISVMILACLVEMYDTVQYDSWRKKSLSCCEIT